MNIVYNDIVSEAEKELSLVSKRMKGRDGSDMYSDVMLSSAERIVMTGFIKDAIHDVLSDIKQFIDIEDETTTAISFEIVRTRKTSDRTIPEQALLSSIKRYAVSSCVFSHLSPLYEVQARKYGSDALRIRRDIIELCFHKSPPVSSGGSFNPSVTIE